MRVLPCLRRRFAVALLVLLVALPAAADDTMYLFIDSLNGDSQDPNHNGWFDIVSLSHELMLPSGGGGQPEVSDISVLRTTDRWTPELHFMSASRNSIQQVKIQVCRSGQGGQQECYYELELTDALITGVDLASSACIDTPGCAGVTSETITFAFRRIAWTFTPWNNGNPGQPISRGYDLPTGQKP